MSREDAHANARARHATIADVEDRLLPLVETVTVHDDAIGDLNLRLRALETALGGSDATPKNVPEEK